MPMERMTTIGPQLGLGQAIAADARPPGILSLQMERLEQLVEELDNQLLALFKQLEAVTSQADAPRNLKSEQIAGGTSRSSMRLGGVINRLEQQTEAVSIFRSRLEV